MHYLQGTPSSYSTLGDLILLASAALPWAQAGAALFCSQSRDVLSLPLLFHTDGSLRLEFPPPPSPPSGSLHHPKVTLSPAQLGLLSWPPQTPYYLNIPPPTASSSGLYPEPSLPVHLLYSLLRYFIIYLPSSRMEAPRCPGCLISVEVTVSGAVRGGP